MDLREKRLSALMTVRELSERSGVSEDTITKIENGHRSGRALTLRKLDAALSGAPSLVDSRVVERRIPPAGVAF